MSTRTEFYCQWFDSQRATWVTPTGWLRHGGYASIEEASTTGAALCRQNSPNVRVRVVSRTVQTTVLDEVPVP